jgi:hypothetical protein
MALLPRIFYETRLSVFVKARVIVVYNKISGRCRLFETTTLSNYSVKTSNIEDSFEQEVEQWSISSFSSNFFNFKNKTHNFLK